LISILIVVLVYIQNITKEAA